MKKNIVIVIFAIIILCLGGYLVYDKVIDKKDGICFENDKINDDGKVENNNKTNNIQILKFYPDSVAVVYNGEVYVNVYGSTPEIDSLYGEGTFQILMNIRNEKYKEYDIEGLKYIGDLNQELKWLKLDISDVKAVYSKNSGQAITNDYGILILKNDGSVYGISLHSLINGRTSVTVISSLNNIIEFNSINVPMSGVFTYAIYKDGNKYNVQEYIPKSYNEW